MRCMGCGSIGRGDWYLVFEQNTGIKVESLIFEAPVSGVWVRLGRCLEFRTRLRKRNVKKRQKHIEDMII